jgi:hypothetical protein
MLKTGNGCSYFGCSYLKSECGPLGEYFLKNVQSMQIGRFAKSRDSKCPHQG